MKVELIEYPGQTEWVKVKQRALVTMGKTKVINAPTDEWKKAMLNARHSPIRFLMFSFFISDLPSWVSVHYARHVHAQPYIKSQRNDRQSEYDRNKAPQDTPVNMILDVNAEELMTIMNKRLCGKASSETRQVAIEMARLVAEKCPEFKEFLIPNCLYMNGCKEIEPCNKRV